MWRSASARAAKTLLTRAFRALGPKEFVLLGIVGRLVAKARLQSTFRRNSSPAQVSTGAHQLRDADQSRQQSRSIATRLGFGVECPRPWADPWDAQLGEAKLLPIMASGQEKVHTAVLSLRRRRKLHTSRLCELSSPPNRGGLGPQELPSVRAYPPAINYHPLTTSLPPGCVTDYDSRKTKRPIAYVPLFPDASPFQARRHHHRHHRHRSRRQGRSGSYATDSDADEESGGSDAEVEFSDAPRSPRNKQQHQRRRKHRKPRQEYFYAVPSALSESSESDEFCPGKRRKLPPRPPDPVSASVTECSGCSECGGEDTSAWETELDSADEKQGNVSPETWQYFCPYHGHYTHDIAARKRTIKDQRLAEEKRVRTMAERKALCEHCQLLGPPHRKLGRLTKLPPEVCVKLYGPNGLIGAEQKPRKTFKGVSYWRKRYSHYKERKKVKKILRKHGNKMAHKTLQYRKDPWSIPY
ncbi:hypothetical protein BDY21DRAFT_364515 [Lineolata rhizophorae]|uniref:Uncharacterized protein n=1 Tax=Lineolata rhizophorae TaxID=578093 RepID=A0A6A6NZI2_9PEZI|nr:hypothetical protein BDY21DRAFT_364515 [Lineolata rhizophorae]